MKILPEIPTLPTDNLYKFKAICGVIMVIISFLFFSWLLSDAWKQMGISLIKSQILQAEVEILRKDITQENVKNLSSNDKELIKQKTNTLNLKSIALNASSDYQFKTLILIAIIFLPTVALIVLGSFLAREGFYSWQVKLQKYQDQIIAYEALKKFKEIDNISKN